MINQEIINYVRQQLSIGVSKEKITEALITQSWSQQDISQAFVITEKTTDTPQPLTSTSPLPQSDPQFVNQNNNSYHVPPSKDHIFWLLVISALIIAALGYFGLKAFVPNEIFLFNFSSTKITEGLYILLLLPAVILSIVISIISFVSARRIYKKRGVMIQSFLFGTAIYFLLTFITIGIVRAILELSAGSVGGEIIFAIGLVFGIVFGLSFQILYLGLLIFMILLLFYLRTHAIEIPQPSSLSSRINYGIIIFVFVLALYVFGAVAPVAKILHLGPLCNLIYSDRAKSDCFFDTSSLANSENPTKETSVGTSVFKTIKIDDYGYVKDLQDIGGKLAYAFENDDETSGVVYDGQLVSSAYKKVGILPIEEVGGKLAYEAYQGEKEIIVWDGKEYGTEYDKASQPTDVGGKLAFVAGKKTTQGKLKNVVVWNGKE